MKMILIIFQKKIVWGRWTILCPKMGHLHKFGSILRIFCKFCTMKSQQVDESNNNGLYQKTLLRTNVSFCARKWHILITLDQL